MNLQKTKAFTLVELIVVITILAILWTIAFISLQWYASIARDSTRISDMWVIEKALTLYNLKEWKYPTTTNWFQITYSWSEVWTQWTFWTWTRAKTWRIGKISTDPLTWLEYTYSTTKNKQEYQLGWLLEWSDLWLNESLFNQTNAWDKVASAIVTGNYNWMMLKTITWSVNCAILSVPSIITSIDWDQDIVQTLTNSWLVYKWYNNLPSNYINSKYKSDGWFDFSSNKLVVYSDTNWCKPLNENTSNWETARTNLITWLQTAYTWTILENEWIIWTVRTTTDTNKISSLGISLVNNNLGGWIIYSNTSVTNSCDDSTKPADDLNKTYIVNPTSPNQPYIQGSTECWYTCNGFYSWVNCDILTQWCSASVTDVYQFTNDVFACKLRSRPTSISDLENACNTGFKLSRPWNWTTTIITNIGYTNFINFVNTNSHNSLWLWWITRCSWNWDTCASKTFWWWWYNNVGTLLLGSRYYCDYDNVQHWDATLSSLAMPWNAITTINNPCDNAIEKLANNLWVVTDYNDMNVYVTCVKE